MTWIQDNKSLAGLIAVILIASGGLGFWLHGNYSAYTASQQGFDRLRSQVQQLQGNNLYPDKENLEQLQSKVAQYRESVHRLRDKLLKHQPPRTKPSATEFQTRLNAQVATFREHAQANGTAFPSGFAFDMDRYTSTPAPEELVPDLNWQLDAVITLAELLVATGVDQVTQFTRTPMLVEQAEDSQKQESKAYQAYPLEIRLVADQETLQRVLNALGDADLSPYYFVSRLVRIENENSVGPPTGAPIVPIPVTRESTQLDIQDSGNEDEESEAPIEEGGEEGGEEDGAGEEAGGDFSDFINPGGGGLGAAGDFFTGQAAPTPSGYIDARIILGNEKLRIYLRVDLLDFYEPVEEEQEDEAEPTDDETTASRIDKALQQTAEAT